MLNINLDHIIVAVNDMDKSVAFWKEILDVEIEGSAGPFTVVRITPELTFQFAPWGTKGGEHFAFALNKAEFEAVFVKIKKAGIPFGDSFHNVGTQTGPGEEEGAKGMGLAVYFNDPNAHLLEIRTYDN